VTIARQLRPGPRGESGPSAARRIADAVAALLLAVLVIGCSVDDRPVIIDGLSLGGVAGCGSCDQPNTSDGCGACESIATIAARHLEDDYPGHPEVLATACYREGWYAGPKGETLLNARSESLTVAVVTFVDGSRHAVSVSCGVGGCH
jgi:hypothetical protein